jgi:hypothetical protein
MQLFTSQKIIRKREDIEFAYLMATVRSMQRGGTRSWGKNLTPRSEDELQQFDSKFYNNVNIPSAKRDNEKFRSSVCMITTTPSCHVLSGHTKNGIDLIERWTNENMKVDRQLNRSHLRSLCMTAFSIFE